MSRLTSRYANRECARLIDEVDRVRTDMVRLVEDSADLLNEVHPRHQASARHLLHYMALRSRDLRPLQAQLAALGLSSRVNRRVVEIFPILTKRQTFRVDQRYYTNPREDCYQKSSDRDDPAN